MRALFSAQFLLIGPSMKHFKVKTVAFTGAHSLPIELECVHSRRLPYIQIIGGGASFVSEVRERVLAALESSGFRLPARKFSIRIAPSLHGVSTESLDLAVALAILGSCGKISPERMQGILVVAGLGLDGKLLPTGRKADLRQQLPNFRSAFLAWEDSDLLETSHLEAGGGFQSLAELVSFLQGGSLFLRQRPPEKRHWPSLAPAWDSLVGDALAKRALLLAAAGAHPSLFLTANSRHAKNLALALRSILPPLTAQEEDEMEFLQQISGGLREHSRPFVPFAPCASPLWTAPGLPKAKGVQDWLQAHRGVLFVEDFPQWGAGIWQGLREPLLLGQVRVGLAGHYSFLPASPYLVAQAVACPCGTRTACSCLKLEKTRYLARLAKYTAGLFDLIVPLGKEIEKSDLGWEEACSQVAAATQLMHSRQKKPNARLEESELFGKTWDAGALLLWRALQRKEKIPLALAKVALTVSDLRQSSKVEEPDLLEARYFHQLEGGAERRV